MESKINETLNYFTFISNEILEQVNSSKNLTVEEIIEKGNKLSELEFKITALEVAKVN